MGDEIFTKLCKVLAYLACQFLKGLLAQGVSEARTRQMQRPVWQMRRSCFVRQKSWRPWVRKSVMEMASHTDTAAMAKPTSRTLEDYDTNYWFHLRSIYREIQLKCLVFIKVNG